MTARAQAAEKTAQDIADAMLRLFGSSPYEQIRLEDVATAAGVTVQTVLRRFGSKAALMCAVVERELAVIANERAAAETGSLEQVIDELVRHYERYGELILKMYREAPLVEGLPELAAAGRAQHLRWCQTAFAARVKADLDPTTRKRRVAQFTAVCDATTWRILRKDRGLSAAQTCRALSELVAPLVG
ncbi:MAG TPA: TetR/AcrR family transcriptional regulator [Mycobacteriales bacterium]|nr:TetR/AcrR family transcriptional regulator [Mycobacteriales bacterium]